MPEQTPFNPKQHLIQLFEIWKPVVGYEGYYEVSDLGNVRSSKVRRGSSGKVLRAGLSTTGYLLVILNKHGRKQTQKVHRLVAIAFLDRTGRGNDVNHIDGNRTNNRLSNLEWVTRSENHLHAYRTLGRRSNKLLTANQEQDVYARYSRGGITQRQLAMLFGVSQGTISRTIARVGGQYDGELRAA